MIKEQHRRKYLSILNSDGLVEISQLSRSMPEVSRVTLRRDIAELARAAPFGEHMAGRNLGIRITASVAAALADLVSAIDEVDAIILPPIHGAGADAIGRLSGAARPVPRRNSPLRRVVSISARTISPPVATLAGRLPARPARGIGNGFDDRAPELPNTRLRGEGFEQGSRRISAERSPHPRSTVRAISGRHFG